MYKSTKIIDGFSTCFRQWKAKDSHCKYLHGYALSFKVVFEAETLDERNWVMDFGFMKKVEIKAHAMSINHRTTTVKDWFDYWFDHTTIISTDDPKRDLFAELDKKQLIQLRIIPTSGCEKFAGFVFEFLRQVMYEQTKGRVKIKSVECIETPKNSAIYEE